VEASVKVTDSGAVPLITDGVNDATGPVITISCEVEFTNPVGPVTVNVTIKVPEEEKLYVGLVAVDVPPSPKFQSREDIVPVEASVKVTDSGAVPLVTDDVNDATGAPIGSPTIIVAEAESINPSELVTVNVTIKVPEEEKL
jgi:hypothetical protein